MNNQVIEQNQNQTQVDKIRSAEADRMNLMFKQAGFYAKSTIVPKEYIDNISNCFIAIEMANRIGANPFQVMQSLNIINGRPSWSSTFIIATINTSGRFKTPLNFDIKGDWKKGNLECTAFATTKDGTVCRGTIVTQQMAIDEGWVCKNGSKWKTMPELMIRYRAASFFGKQFCPEILMGLQTTEEILDIDPISVVDYSESPKVKEEIKTNANVGAKIEFKEEEASVKEVELVVKESSKLDASIPTRKSTAYDIPFGYDED